VRRGWLLSIGGLVVTLAGATERMEDFGYASMITFAPGDALYALALPAAVYRHAYAADLSDLRVFNSAGETVSHALRAPPEAQNSRAASTRLPIFPVLGGGAGQTAANDLRVEVRRDGAVVSVRAPKAGEAASVVAWLADASKFDSALDSLELAIAGDGDVVAKLSVEASDDLKHWIRVTDEAPVLRVRFAGERLEHLRIALDGARAKYLRLVDARGAFPFPLAGVRAIAPSESGAPVLETLTLAPSATDDSARAWEFDSGGHFPVESIGLVVPEDNAVVPFEVDGRSGASAPWRWVGRGVAYRFTQDGLTVTSRPLAVTRSTGRFLRVRMTSGSGALPAVAPKLALRWQPAELVFAARGSPPFTLAYGRANVTGAAFPITMLIPGYGTDSALKPKPAQVSEEHTLAGERAKRPAPNYHRWALWGVLGIGVVVLGAMGLKLAREAGTPHS